MTPQLDREIEEKITKFREKFHLVKCPCNKEGCKEYHYPFNDEVMQVIPDPIDIEQFMRQAFKEVRDEAQATTKQELVQEIEKRVKYTLETFMWDGDKDVFENRIELNKKILSLLNDK